MADPPASVEAAEPCDGLIDQRLVGRSVMLVGNDRRCGARRGVSGLGADFSDRSAFGGGDLVLGHFLAARNELGAVALGLCEHQLRLGFRMSDNRGGIAGTGSVAGLGLSQQRLGFSAEA